MRRSRLPSFATLIVVVAMLLSGCRIVAAQPPFPLVQIVIVLPGEAGPGSAVAFEATDSGATQDLAAAEVEPEHSVVAPRLVPSFRNVAVDAGVDVKHEGAAPVMPLGGGVAFGDYNNDGYLDLYVTNQGGANALYQNQGDGTFVDQAAIAGVTAASYIGSGSIFGDYDNDGWRDLYVVNLGENLLFHNNGDDTFTDVTNLAGVGDIGFGQSAAWGDYDNDGLIDLYVVNHEGPDGNADRLYHNEGDGRFQDVSTLLSHHLRSAAGFVATFVDYDDDGDVDLYVVNDKTFGTHRANVLWQNEGPDSNGTWRFRDVSTRARASTVLNGMGLAVGDFDNDSDQDFAISNIGPNVLLSNNGRGQFSDVSRVAGIERGRLPGDREPLTWCVLSLDADNDGWLDLFFCGSPLDKGDGLPSALFHNQQNGTFLEISAAAGFTAEAWTRSGAYGDYDNDGAVDFYVVNYDQPGALYRNTLYDAPLTSDEPKPNWLTVRLIGLLSNRDALGAKVSLSADGQTKVRQIQSGGSLGAGNDLAAYFGLGRAKQVDRLEIQWPSGIVQIMTDLSINQTLVVTEAMNSSVESDLRIEARNIPDHGVLACGEPFALQIHTNNLGYQTIDASRVDYTVATTKGEKVLEERIVTPALQRLGTSIVRLPAWFPRAGEEYELTVEATLADRMPTDATIEDNQIRFVLHGASLQDRAFAAGIVEEEPGVAVASADVNGDGFTDLYLINNSRPNILYLNKGDGTFQDATARAGIGYSGVGSGAVFGDFNQDGAVDLYLLNLAEDNVYYQNRGNGTFVDMTAAARLSHRGSSRAAASADFDGDGDLDIYLVNDGQANVLFLNQGDGTFETAPERVGLTDRGNGRNVAVADFDGNGSVDIYLVKDQEANVLYLNQGDGTFSQSSVETGAADTGRGRAATVSDFDQDGDVDLFVVNLAEANRLYLNRGNGTFDSESVASVFDEAEATIGAVAADLNRDGLPDLIVANTGGQPNHVYLNQGEGHFEHALAAFSAEDVANSMAVMLADFNNDGGADLYVVNGNLPDQLYLNPSPRSDDCW